MYQKGIAKVPLRVSFRDWREFGKKEQFQALHTNKDELIVFQDIARHPFWQFTMSFPVVWSHFQDKRTPHKETPTTTLLPVSDIIKHCTNLIQHFLISS